MSFLTIPLTVTADIVQTTFLGDLNPANAVPSTAVFKSGAALEAATGALYTCAYVPAGNYSYVEKEGTRVREDGAVCTITTAGDLHLAGISMTEEGETVVAENTPVVFLHGIGLLATGAVCVSDEA